MVPTLSSYLIELIISADICIEQRQTYGIPFFYYGGKRICYLNEKENGTVDLGFCNGVALELYSVFPDARKEKVILVKNFSSLQEIDNLQHEIIAALSAEIDFIKQKQLKSR